MVRRLLANFDSTVRFFVAVAITAIVALGLNARWPIVAMLLILGVFTAAAEYSLHWNGQFTP